MNPIPHPQIRRLGLRLVSHARALLAVSALAALAVPNRAAAQNPFAVTTLSPSSQTAVVGTPCSVNIVFADPAGSYTAYGIQAWIKFDPAKLQVVSVSTGGSSPFASVFANQFDNTNGTLTYGATGGNLSGASVTVATIVFNPIAAGTSAIQFLNVNEYIVGYGPYGVGGTAVGGSITVTAPLPTQTLTILGGSGNVGDIAANVEYYNPATGQWQPAYLANYAPYGHPVTHPWGNISGTNHWINYRTDGGSDPGAGPTIAKTLWYSYRVRFTVPADAQNPQMTFSIKADNLAQVAINGVTTGGTQMLVNNVLTNNVIDGQADQLNADAVFSQAVHTGENTITINVGDYGGLNGFNFRIDLSMQSSQSLQIVPATPPDTTPPVITAPVSITKEATGPSGAAVTFVPAPTATDNVDGSVPVTATPPSGSTFALGSTTVHLTAKDAANNTASASFPVTVQDTTPPSIGTAPTVAPVEATGASGAQVTFTVPSATDIVDGTVPVTASPASGSTFTLGTTTVTLSATDAHHNTSSKTFDVTVQDTTPPAIASVTTNAPTLWPPNHKMVAVSVTALASDAVGVTSLKIINVTSSEPDNGLGDGDTAGDIQITGDLTVNLRAERAGNGNGRTYTITVQAKDAAGNASTKTCTVLVPKSQGGK